VAILVGGAVLVGLAAERVRRPLPHTLLTAVATWTVVGGTSLDREGAAIDRQLAGGRLDEARVQLTHLVGRDTSRLEASEVVRAAVESLAENTSDAVVAPLVWGAVAGMPGLLGYRAANTLDAMVGHRSSRYERFGWAAARLDDLLNLPGSRLSGLLAVALAPSVGGSPRAALEAWRRDAGGHPSPNAGVVEAAFAGALGVQLGGRNDYAHGTEDRARLGRGAAPSAYDVGRAVALSRRVGTGAAVLAALAGRAVTRGA
jgi:adenosylcobinamide-phosphate synthase